MYFCFFHSHENKVKYIFVIGIFSRQMVIHCTVMQLSAAWMLTASVTADSHIRRSTHKQMYYQTKKLLEVSCKYRTTVKVIGYKVILSGVLSTPIMALAAF